MTYTPIDWVGKTDPGGSLSKLSAMQGNLEHIRDDLDYRLVASSAMRSEGGSGQFPGASSSTVCRLTAYGPRGGSPSSTFTADGTEKVISGLNDWDVTNWTNGQVAEVSLWLEADAGGGAWTPVAEVGRFWYLKNADEDRLRIGGTISVYANREWYSHADEPSPGYLWAEVSGMTVVSFRDSVSDPRWTDITWSNGDLVSDTKMNGMFTNAQVLRDRINAHVLGGGCLHGTGTAANFQNLEANHALRFTLTIDGTTIGQVATPFPIPSAYTTYVMKNRDTLPASPQWGLMVGELRVQYANASSPGLWVGEDYQVGSPGWVLQRFRFWRSPEDTFVHAYIAARDWMDRDRWWHPAAGWVTVKTVGSSYFATREPIP